MEYEISSTALQCVYELAELYLERRCNGGQKGGSLSQVFAAPLRGTLGGRTLGSYSHSHKFQ